MTELTFDECAADFYESCFKGYTPLFVPSRVRIKSLVRGDFPIGHKSIVELGEYDCQSNKWGAVSVLAQDGRLLGIKPNELQILAWRKNSIES